MLENFLKNESTDQKPEGGFSMEIPDKSKEFESKFLELEMRLAKDLGLIMERLNRAVAEQNQTKIDNVMNEISMFEEYYKQQDVEQFLQNPRYRKDLIWLNAQIYKNQIPFLENNEESMKNLSMSLYFLLKPIEQDIYKNPDNYIYDFKKKRGDADLDRSTDLFFILNAIDRYGSGVANYRYVSEAAFMNGFCYEILANYGKAAETVYLLQDLYKNGSNEFKEELNAIFEKELKQGNFDFFSKILVEHRSTNIEKKIFEILNSYFLEQFNIKTKNFAESLNYSENTLGALLMNVQEMILLEKLLSGSVKRLHEEYGIYEFGRYPVSMLIDQLNMEDSQVPYGVLVWPRNDHNQAFLHMGHDLDELYSDTRGRHLIRVFEAGSKIDMARILLKNNEKYGAENKISFLVLGGHGELESLNLGDDYLGAKGSKVIEKSDFDGMGVQKIKNFFVEKPTIVLVSCSTGGDKGLIETVSKTYDAEVIAPKEPTMLDSIRAEYDENNRPQFKVSFTGNVERRVISGKDVQ